METTAINMDDLNTELGKGDDGTQKDRFMTFRCGEECFGIAISYVEEIATMQPITPVPGMEDFVKGLINLRGKIVPVLDVRVRFCKEPVPYNDRTCIMVVAVRDSIIGLIIDTITGVAVIGKKDIVSPPASGEILGPDRFVYGIGKDGDSVKLLIDPEKLIFDQMYRGEE